MEKASVGGNRKDATEDIFWLIKQADELSARRDEAIHSPKALIKGENQKVEISSAWFLGNPLAIRLKGKNILQEFSLSIWRAGRLNTFADEIAAALTDERHPWPQTRPKLNRETHLLLMETARRLGLE